MPVIRDPPLTASLVLVGLALFLGGGGQDDSLWWLGGGAAVAVVVLAGLRRQGWAGRLVWGFAPVQDRHAAPAIVRALGDLAALAQVDVVIVARGGGSLADLLCFCDETLCRTVALLNLGVTEAWSVNPSFQPGRW